MDGLGIWYFVLGTDVLKLCGLGTWDLGLGNWGRRLRLGEASNLGELRSEISDLRSHSTNATPQ